jgi:1-phosphatidylinositol-4-phosphate 5-kinase
MYHLRRKVHFVIMASVFDTPQPIHAIYDLKGSLIGREATKTERDKGGVLKDLDLVNDKQMIHLGKKRDVFLQQLERDANFLASLNIMDYSLLVNSIFLVSLTFFRNLK